MDETAGQLCETLWAASRVVASAQAQQLRGVAALADWCATQARRELARGPRVSGQPDDETVIDTSVVAEVAATLGVSEPQAGAMVDLAERLTRVLPDTLSALEAGRLDLDRARALVEATAVLDDSTAREVEAALLPRTGASPWDVDSPSQRAWRSRVSRAVLRADLDAARRRRDAALTMRRVRAWSTDDGLGVLQVVGPQHDIAMADRVVDDLAHAWPSVDAEGQPVSIDQRRADALLDLFRRVRDQQPLPAVPVRREREIGLVLHADTLFGDGPAARAPGELRGLGAPAYVDPRTARDTARRDLGAGLRTTVLLTGPAQPAGPGTGMVQRVLRLPHAREGRWTRETLVAAVRQALRGAPPLDVSGYAPSQAIVAHVRAAYPTCTHPDCPRAAHRCDLDHNDPWPRGPTATDNLRPRCRRHHELKTRGLLRTRLEPDGSVTTTSLTGRRRAGGPEPLPGHGPGEGYADGVRLAVGTDAVSRSA
jgi:hypothetical protein